MERKLILWACVTNKGRLIPSTIRHKRGDSKAALSKYRIDAESCTVVRVAVEIVEQKPMPNERTTKT